MARKLVALAVGVPGLLVLVFASSWLGLNGQDIVVPNPDHDALDFFVRVWSDSVIASAMFLLGSVAAFAWTIHRGRKHPVGAAAAAVALHWLVYFASYNLLVGQKQHEGWFSPDSFVFVGQWGFLGLAFSALVPGVIALALRWRAGEPLPRPRNAALVAGFVLIALVLARPGFGVDSPPASLEGANLVQFILLYAWSPASLAVLFVTPAAAAFAMRAGARSHPYVIALVGVALQSGVAVFARFVTSQAPGSVAVALAGLASMWPFVLFAAVAPALASAASGRVAKGAPGPADDAEGAATQPR